MTTPGGVPNLPVGALTVETLASNLQDMSGTAMKARAVERFPSIMNGSTGLNPALDVTPFGILTRIYGEATSVVANADPADINGPEDIPQLLLEFIEGLPVIGHLVRLVEAILGNYDGNDEVLLAIQAVFAPIRRFFQMITGIFTGFPSVSQVELAELPQQMVQGLTAALSNLGAGVESAIAGTVGVIASIVNAWFGGGGSAGTLPELTYTIEAIKDAVINGYAVSTIVFDTVAWPVPPHVEFTAILVGGGQSGSGATGGLHGSYRASSIDLTGVDALDIQVGTAGNVSFIRQAATTPHTGPVIAQSPVHGGPGGISTTFGFAPTTSLPGSGGDAGASGTSRTDGLPGGTTALALGGAGGAAGLSGADGQSGGSVSAGSQDKCGGGGGGGGGGASGAGGHGGDGGAGGYPGGGGGGRALGWAGGANGVVGPGAPGIVWLFVKLIPASPPPPE